MDIKQAFAVVTERIKKLEPHELATRIVGFLLFNYGEEEMIRLAHCSDQVIEEVVHLVKSKFSRLGTNLPNPPLSPCLTPKPVIDIPTWFNPVLPPGFALPIGVERLMPNWDGLVLHDQKLSYHDALTELQNKAPYLSLVDNYDQGERGQSNFYTEEERRPDLLTKPCHYFSRGSCKNGNSCRYIHEQPSPNSLITPIFDSQFVNDEHMFLPGSLERLEMEITELLKMRGEPIQIASLPVIYFATYGKPLQANGYQIERQRNGKHGYGLTKLLGCMKNSLRIIDRPNGQHLVILAEDVPKYFEYKSGRNSPGPIVNGSRQIYLTFPKESTFTEEDVAEYFSKFGKVEDVRMPCQQERMFGFVTFSNPETASAILNIRSPHLVAGSQVLAKPYREKSKFPDRRNTDMDSELLTTPRGLFEAARLLKKEPQVEEQYIDGQCPNDFQFAPNNAELERTGHRDHFPTDATTNNLPNSDSTQEIRLPDSLSSSPISNNQQQEPNKREL